MNDNPKIDSTIMTVRVEIVPMNPWYDMRRTLDGGVEIVNRDGDPMYVSRESIEPDLIAERLEDWLKGRDLDRMWTVQAITPVADGVRSAEDLAAGAEVATADYVVGAGVAKMIEGALSGLLSIVEAVGERPTVEEIYGMYQKAMPKMLAAPGGAETLQIMACALLAQRTAGIKP